MLSESPPLVLGLDCNPRHRRTSSHEFTHPVVVLLTGLCLSFFAPSILAYCCGSVTSYRSLGRCRDWGPSSLGSLCFQGSVGQFHSNAPSTRKQGEICPSVCQHCIIIEWISMAANRRLGMFPSCSSLCYWICNQRRVQTWHLSCYVGTSCRWL